MATLIKPIKQFITDRRIWNDNDRLAFIKKAINHDNYLLYARVEQNWRKNNDTKKKSFTKDFIINQRIEGQTLLTYALSNRNKEEEDYMPKSIEIALELFRIIKQKIEEKKKENKIEFNINTPDEFEIYVKALICLCDDYKNNYINIFKRDRSLFSGQSGFSAAATGSIQIGQESFEITENNIFGMLYMVSCFYDPKFKEKITDDNVELIKEIILFSPLIENDFNKNVGGHREGQYGNTPVIKISKDIVTAAQSLLEKIKGQSTGKYAFVENPLLKKITVVGDSSPSIASESTTTSKSPWTEHFSEKHQRKYWKNTDTGKSTWEDPEELQPVSKIKETKPSSGDHSSVLDKSSGVSKLAESLGPKRQPKAKFTDEIKGELVVQDPNPKIVALSKTTEQAFPWTTRLNDSRVPYKWENKKTREITFKRPQRHWERVLQPNGKLRYWIDPVNDNKPTLNRPTTTWIYLNGKEDKNKHGIDSSQDTWLNTLTGELTHEEPLMSLAKGWREGTDENDIRVYYSDSGRIRQTYIRPTAESQEQFGGSSNQTKKQFSKIDKNMEKLF